MTDWVTNSPNLLDAELAIDKPADFQKKRDLRDRDSYLFESATRGGTFLIPHRFAYSSMRKVFSITLSGATGSTTVAFDFTTPDSTEGDPNFGANPRIAIGLAQDTSGGAINWTTNHVSVTAFIANGTLSTTGLTVGVVAERNSGSGTLVKGNVMLHLFGDPTSGE